MGRRTRNFGFVYRFLLLSLYLTPLVAFHPVAGASDSTPSQSPVGIEWRKGPFLADLGGVAQIEIPKGYAFTGKAGAQRFLELGHNPSSGQELGLVVPIPSKGNEGAGDWFMLFEFDETGYITDNDQSNLDADALLASIKKGTEQGNEIRKQRGWAPYHVIGWSRTPFYDPYTHNLTWATMGEEEGSQNGKSVNYSVRILGRRGAMSADLVLDPSQVDAVLPEYKVLLDNFSYTSGNKYAEFMKGDKVAGYGLTALIAGGATAVAIKTGLLAKLWKLIVLAIASLWKFMVVIFAGIAAYIRKIFGKLFRRTRNAERPRVEAPSTPQLQATSQISDNDRD